MRSFERHLAILAALLVTESALANLSITMTASPMRFVYSRGAGGAGSLGRIDITSTTNASLLLQQINFGSDNVLGGGNDSVIDLGSLGQFKAKFTGDIFKLDAANAYAVVGSYTVVDAAKTVILEGDFVSQGVTMVDGALSVVGELANQTGIVRQSGLFSNLQPAILGSATPGGQDGPNFADLSDASLLGSLFEVQLQGQGPNLDAFFGSSFQVNTSASILTAPFATPVPVPAPGAATLAILGLAMLVRRLRAVPES